MLLTRFTQSLRRQDWATVLLELVVLVVGILLALQVDNWNQQRKDAVQGGQWRVQILDDLHKARTAMARRRDYFQGALEFGEVSLAGLTASEPVDDEAAWDIVLGAFQASQIWPYQLTGPTYREAQNAGGLEWVGNAEILAALAGLYDISAHDYELVTGGLPKYREVIRERMPWPLQNYIWGADCQETIRHEGEAGNAYILTRCPATADKILVQEVLGQFRADQELQQLLTGRLSQLRISVDSTDRRVEFVDRVIELFE